ncbi:MAG: PocR ligand-binding domain-containing protein [Deltaproteobacteria bacterium]|nr:PocR ligand-binding domain-containing protein [Deltaproteobacteria bacterium]
MNVDTSVLDHDVPLAELLDIEGFRDVCRSFCDLYGIGIKVFDGEGSKIVDVRASTGDHCGYLFTVHATQVLCTNLVNQIRTTPLSKTSGIATIDCFSGLKYKIVPLRYEGSLLGRFIFGPYAPAALEQPPAALSRHEPELNLATLAKYQSKLPRATEETIGKVVSHITNVFDVLIHANHRAHLTSRLHIASVSSTFAELEKTNRDLKQANEKLQDLDRLKSNFIATVSHELRTPLTSVIGYSEMLLEGMAGELSKEQREYINTILEKGESLLTLIGQVLDMSRIESGNVLVQRQPTEIRSVMELSVTDVLPQARKRGVTIVVEVAPDVAPIAVDRDKVRRIITNLLANAVKFSPASASVALKADLVDVAPATSGHFDVFEPERNRHLRLQVADQGIGIPPDKLDRIFEAFFQVDNTSTREFGGTGLGLAIVRNFAHAHAGRVEVQSQVGAGSTFSVLLPYVTDIISDNAGVEVLSSQQSA